eukprot:1146015-Pelagomonas_calceolata.AAC.2
MAAQQPQPTRVAQYMLADVAQNGSIHGAPGTHFICRALLVGELLWVRQCRAGGGESKPAGTRLKSRWTLSSCFPSALA